MNVLNDFAEISGLVINMCKSSLFLAGRIEENLISAATSFGFPVEHLPIQYLGLCLTTKNMSKFDYEPLIDKIRSRFLSWMN